MAEGSRPYPLAQEETDKVAEGDSRPSPSKAGDTAAAADFHLYLSVREETDTVKESHPSLSVVETDRMDNKSIQAEEPSRSSLAQHQQHPLQVVGYRGS